MKNKLIFWIFLSLVAVTFALKAMANQSPQAVGGDDQTVVPGASVTFDGSGSYDPDGDSLTYSWQETSTSGTQIDNPDSVSITLTAPTTEGDYIFKLYVKDGMGGLDSDEVTLTIEAAEVTTTTTTTTTGSAASEESGSSFDGGSESGCSLNQIRSNFQGMSVDNKRK